MIYRKSMLAQYCVRDCLVLKKVDSFCYLPLCWAEFSSHRRWRGKALSLPADASQAGSIAKYIFFKVLCWLALSVVIPSQ